MSCSTNATMFSFSLHVGINTETSMDVEDEFEPISSIALSEFMMDLIQLNASFAATAICSRRYFVDLACLGKSAGPVPLPV
jgi:hypothetical protein